MKLICGALIYLGNIFKLRPKISSPEHQKWVTKLFGYDYEIIYKKGKDNVVAYALSRKYEHEGSLFSLSFIVPD
jgi:hypothetical protein